MCHGSMTSYFLVATMQDQVKGSLAADPHHAPTPPLPLKPTLICPFSPPPPCHPTRLHLRSKLSLSDSMSYGQFSTHIFRVKSDKRRSNII